MSAIEIRDARGAALAQGCSLLARSLRFNDRDALPPWLMQTAAQRGGLALGAFDDGALIGFSAAIPAESDALFSCGLAVEERCRGRGVARRLKLAQRDRALAQGRSVIRWTADPLSVSALALYLAALGARLVAYEPELYAAVRPSPVPPDDVTIEWQLDAAPCSRGRSAACVEVPFDHRTLKPREVGPWRMRVRRSMTRAMETGAVGTGMALDRASRRAWVLFTEPT